MSKTTVITTRVPKPPDAPDAAANTDNKPFTLETFSLGDADTPTRNELYAARGH